jgi:hypothetical protein
MTTLLYKKFTVKNSKEVKTACSNLPKKAYDSKRTVLPVMNSIFRCATINA